MPSLELSSTQLHPHHNRNGASTRTRPGTAAPARTRRGPPPPPPPLFPRPATTRRRARPPAPRRRRPSGSTAARRRARGRRCARGTSARPSTGGRRGRRPRARTALGRDPASPGAGRSSSAGTRRGWTPGASSWRQRRLWRRRILLLWGEGRCGRSGILGFRVPLL